MKWTRDNLICLLVQLCLLAASLLAGRRGLFAGHGPLPALCFIVAQVAVVLLWLRACVLPVRRLARTLVDCSVQPDDAVSVLAQNAGKVIFAQEISELLDVCTKQTLLENDAKLSDRQATLTALQSQINPHFLYNTLDTIRGQALIDGNSEIAKMTEALAGAFRYSISSSGELVTVRDELANVKNYMMIQEYRFDNRYQLFIDLDENEQALDNLIPRLSLQPIVENAIMHGLRDTVEKGMITVDISLPGRDMVITISDNGCGMDAKQLDKLNKQLHSAASAYGRRDDDQSHHAGVALANINRRIQLLFGGDYGLTLYSTPGQGTDVEITLPASVERIGRGR